MPPVSGKQRKAQLKLKRAIKRGDQQPEQPNCRRESPRARAAASNQAKNARGLQSQFAKLDKQFLDDTRALAGLIILRRPIQSGVAVLDIPQHDLAPLTVPRRTKWRYQMSKEELDANEQAHFRTWLTQQDAIIEQWKHTLKAPIDQTNPSDQQVRAHFDDSESHSMPHPPTHFERNIEVWRQFWRVTEISQILLVLLDSRCPPLHLPPSLSSYLHIPTSASLPETTGSRAKQTARSKSPRVILVLTKVDISGPARTESWTSFLDRNYSGVPVVPVEAYAQKPFKQGPTRYEPHLPGTFRERLVHTLRDVHEQLLQPPQWVTITRAGESEQERLQRIDRWRPRVKRAIDWDSLLRAKGKRAGKAVGSPAVSWAHETEGDEGGNASVSDNEDEQPGDTYERKEPEFLTIGLVGQPNVGKSSLLNAIFGTTRVRASRTPGKTKHFQTLFWTSEVRLVDCPGLVMPSFVPMDIQVLSGVLPISRVAAVPFCVHQLAQLLPLEQILELTHPSESASSTVIVSKVAQFSKSSSNSEPTNSTPVEDKRTWRPGQRPSEGTKISSNPTGWTAIDIMTAYAEKRGWVTAKAGRPDIHRAGNAILRLVAEGKIPWGLCPPGSSVPNGNDGIWLKDGVQQYTEEDLESDSDKEELASEDDSEVEINIATAGSDVEEEDKVFRGNPFGVLSIDSD